MSASYTRFSDDIELPPAEIMQRDTFVFKGWNETDKDGVASGTKITVIKKGSVGDVYVQADWAESGIHETEDGVFYIGCDSTAKSEENIAW